MRSGGDGGIGTVLSGGKPVETRASSTQVVREASPSVPGRAICCLKPIVVAGRQLFCGDVAAVVGVIRLR
jgi:hypothetical protein